MNPQSKTQLRNIAAFVLLNVLVLLYIEYGSTDDERYQDGLDAYQNQNYSKTFNIMTSLADKEYSGAESMLATLYSKGQGVDVDMKLAAFWSEKAAEHARNEEKKSTENNDIPLN